jgi:hypothetical protein
VAVLTNKEWGKIHAKAWTDPKFRKLLERDPTKAIKAYGKEVGKTFNKMVKVTPRPKKAKRGATADQLVHFHPHPPSCC